MPKDIPTYNVGWYVSPAWVGGYLTYSGSGRRVVSTALPLRPTRLAALYDLQKWLERRIAKGDNYAQIGPQFARIRAQFEAEVAEAKVREVPNA
jgi:hypothetical protein